MLSLSSGDDLEVLRLLADLSGASSGGREVEVLPGCVFNHRRISVSSSSAVHSGNREGGLRGAVDPVD
jgi:hypothetical protein